MKTDRIVLSRETVKSDKANTIKTEVYYNKGGINVFSGKNEPRGYWLSVTPVTVEQRNGYGVESFIMSMGGYKQFLQEASRFNRGTLEKVVEGEMVKKYQPLMLARIKNDLGIVEQGESKDVDLEQKAVEKKPGKSAKRTQLDMDFGY
jgi:hypothetical protein